MSVKQRLREALVAERQEAQDAMAVCDLLIYEIDNRGSGPLPSHLKWEAQRRGILRKGQA